MPITATVTAGLVVPLVLAGELRGRIFEGNCEEAGAEVRLAGFRELVGGEVRPVVVSTGDVLGPEPLSGYALKGPAAVQDDLLSVLRTAGRKPVFDAVLPGNYELSARHRVLRRLGSAALPWTVANADLDAPFRRYRVLVRRRARIGLTAVVDESLASSISPLRRPDLRDSGESLGRAVAALRKARVHGVVALIHVGRNEGLSRIVEILESMNGRVPDIVLTSPLRGNPSIVRLDGLRTVVVPAPRTPAQAAVIELVFGEYNRIDEVRARRKPVPALPSAAADVVRNWVCGRLDVPIPMPPLSDSISKDAFIHFTLERMRRLAGAEIALVNAGSFGPEGAFPLSSSPTELEVRRALPFEDRLEVAEVRGADLNAFEALASDPRVASVGIEDGQVAGRLIDSSRRYKVVTIDFLADGGDALLEPEAFDFRSVEGISSLRAAILRTLRRQGFHEDADPDTDPWVREPTLLDARLNIGASVKSVSVENRAQAEAPQLARDNFLGISGDLELRLSLDFPDHRFELIERTRYGVIRESPEDGGEPEAVENEDVTTIELTYAGRLADDASDVWVPDAGALAQFETELTIPEERDYRRGLLSLGIGPLWGLTGNLSVRSQFGLRWEVFANPDAEDENEDADAANAEAAVAEPRVALLSSAELRDETLQGIVGRQVLLNIRVDHSVDFSGQVRDHILQGRVALDVPVWSGVALTAGVDVYFLQRSQRGEPPASSAALDTSFGIKSTTDLSRALY